MGLYVTETSGPEVVKLSSDLYEYFCLDTVQDFLIKLGIKPRMHLWEISILSLNSVIVRPTKIMIRADKNWAHF
jgi:hypothetical protein